MPQRLGSGRGQQPYRSRVRRPPSGGLHQRNRRAGRQRLVGRNHHGIGYPEGPFRGYDQCRHHSDLRGQPHGQPHHRHGRPVQQGHRWGKRFPPRIWHSPRRRAERPLHLRSHATGTGGRSRKPWCWASSVAGQAFSPDWKIWATPSLERI